MLLAKVTLAILRGEADWDLSGGSISFNHKSGDNSMVISFMKLEAPSADEASEA